MINFYQNLFTSIARFKIGYFTLRIENLQYMKKISFCLLWFLKCFSFGGGLSFSPISTCRCARKPRSASSRLLICVSHTIRKKGRGGQPTQKKIKGYLSVLWNFHEDVLDLQVVMLCRKYDAAQKNDEKKS